MTGNRSRLKCVRGSQRYSAVAVDRIGEFRMGALAERERSWVTTRELSRSLSVAYDTVRRWIHIGAPSPSGKSVRLPATKLGRGYRIEKVDLDAFLDNLRSVAPEDLGETDAQLRRRLAREQQRTAELLG